MKTTVKILIGVSALVIGFWLGRNEFPRCDKVDTTELVKLVDSLNFLNADLKTDIKEIRAKDSISSIHLDSINKAHNEKRKSKVSTVARKKLENRLINKGVEEFGGIGVNDQTETALLFGNQFADNYSVMKKQLQNQKVVNVKCFGIVKNQEIIIESQGEVIRQFVKRKDKVKTKAGWFVAGVVTGIVIPL